MLWLAAGSFGRVTGSWGCAVQRKMAGQHRTAAVLLLTASNRDVCNYTCRPTRRRCAVLTPRIRLLSYCDVVGDHDGTDNAFVFVMNWRGRQLDRTFAAASPNERARRIEPRCLIFDNCPHRRARPGPPRCGRSEQAEFDATRIKSASMMSMNALQLEAAMKAYTDNRAKNGSPIVIYRALSMPVGAIRRPVSCTSEATQRGASLYSARGRRFDIVSRMRG